MSSAAFREGFRSGSQAGMRGLETGIDAGLNRKKRELDERMGEMRNQQLGMQLKAAARAERERRQAETAFNLAQRQVHDLQSSVDPADAAGMKEAYSKFQNILAQAAPVVVKSPEVARQFSAMRDGVMETVWYRHANEEMVATLNQKLSAQKTAREMGLDPDDPKVIGRVAGETTRAKNTADIDPFVAFMSPEAIGEYRDLNRPDNPDGTFSQQRLEDLQVLKADAKKNALIEAERLKRKGQDVFDGFSATEVQRAYRIAQDPASKPADPRMQKAVAYIQNDLWMKAKDSGDPENMVKLSSMFDKNLRDGQETSLQKSLQAVKDVERIQGLLFNEDGSPKIKTGPIQKFIAAFKAGTVGDKDVSALKAAINGAVPNLARGVFGEVGVLTDQDIKNYIKIMPNMGDQEATNKVLADALQRMVNKSIVSRVESYAKQRINVAPYLEDYRKAKAALKATSVESNGVPVFSDKEALKAHLQANGGEAIYEAPDGSRKRVVPQQAEEAQPQVEEPPVETRKPRETTEELRQQLKQERDKNRDRSQAPGAGLPLGY